MPKRLDPETEGFGQRLAAFRKTAGYTQQQLADEIGASRRQITYYEASPNTRPLVSLSPWRKH